MVTHFRSSILKNYNINVIRPSIVLQFESEGILCTTLTQQCFDLFISIFHTIPSDHSNQRNKIKKAIELPSSSSSSSISKTSSSSSSSIQLNFKGLQNNQNHIKSQIKTLLSINTLSDLASQSVKIALHLQKSLVILPEEFVLDLLIEKYVTFIYIYISLHYVTIMTIYI